MKTALYARVSTSDQNCEMQLTALREYVGARGWTVAGEYVDTGWSGAKASRPAFNRLMADAKARRFDTVAVWKMDRFGRSVQHFIEAIADLRSAGVRFIATDQGIDTDASNPASRLMFHLLVAFAEFEREIIKERVVAGLQRAKTKGTRSGRPIGRPRRIFDRGAVLRLRAEGKSIEAIARDVGVGVGTVARILQAEPAATFQNPSAAVA